MLEHGNYTSLKCIVQTRAEALFFVLYFITLCLGLHSDSLFFFDARWVWLQQICCHYVSREPNQDNGGILPPKGTYTTQYIKNSYNPQPF
jgi:hypothetical protein